MFKVGFVLGHWCTLALVVVCATYSGCANEGKRETWQDCAGVYHEVCAGDRECEYVLYKACINE